MAYFCRWTSFGSRNIPTIASMVSLGGGGIVKYNYVHVVISWKTERGRGRHSWTHGIVGDLHWQKCEPNSLVNVTVDGLEIKPDL